MDPQKLFDAYYFSQGCGNAYERTPEWLNFFGAIADEIIKRIQPSVVLDAGCAMGFLVESLRDRGVEAYGIDVSSFAIANVRPDIQPYCWVGSILEPLPQKYDLIVSIEVLEHLQRTDSEQALLNLCQYTNDFLFSSSPDDFRESTHYNVQPAEYWGEQFALAEFIRDVDFDASFILPWASRYRRRSESWPTILKAYERRFNWVVRENVGLRQQLQLRENQIRLQQEQAFSQIEKIQDLEGRLGQITASRGWEMFQKLKAFGTLVPKGSLRERLMQRLLSRLC